MPLDNEIDETEKVVRDAGEGAKEVGEAKQDVDKAEQDAKDGDQDTADKASNVGHGGADALRDGDDALKDWGILDDDDTSISDIADGIDDFTEEAFGKKHPPDSLPPVRYRLFFGKQDDIEAGLENLLDDGMGAADSLLEAGAAAIGGVAGQYLGSDPFSSIMEKHSPFAEDPAELDAAESIWKVVQVRCEEGLNHVWRCELLIITDEVRDPDLEDELDQQAVGGGLIDQVAGPIKNVMGTVEQIGGVFSGDPNAPAPSSPAAKRIAGIKGAADRFDNAGSIGEKIGAVSDMVFGEEAIGHPDATPNTNIPVDPADFLGQTCSVRISREFSASPDDTRPNDVPGHSFTARYLTGVVLEMDDLGTRANKLPPGVGSNQTRARLLRIVLRPELAKLALRHDHRVFNGMHAIAIVREVFRSAGVYGALPDIPGVGMATDALGDLAGQIPFVGGLAADALSGQFVKLMPPPVKDSTSGIAKAGGKLGPGEWTQVREMCVQYGETDLDFVRRLLEEEGIHFTFTCRRGFERIVLVHDPSELDEAPSVDGRPTLYHWPHWQTQPPFETLTDAAEWRKIRPSAVTLRDFSFSVGNQRATTLSEPKQGSPGGMVSLTAEASQGYGERYEYPGSYPFQYVGGPDLIRGDAGTVGAPDPDDPIHYDEYGTGKEDRELALLRLEEEAASARRVTLTTNLVGAGCDTTLRLRGFNFQRDGLVRQPIDGPPKADRIVVERVRWSGCAPKGLVQAATGANFELDPAPTDYQNEIRGWWLNWQFPGTTPVRPPRRTPKPRITSLTTATVVDWTGDHDEDEEIEHEHPTSARIRVRFHWDRRGELPLGILPPIGHLTQRGASCWCRVTQAWAGDDFGVLFVPRVGTEVVVAFEHGDPDRPVIVGSLYDGEHPIPDAGREIARDGFSPPKVDSVQLSTISTRTSPWDEDDGVASELSFDDSLGSERVYLKAGRHLIEEVYGPHRTKVKRAQSNEVGRHHGEIVEKQQHVEITENRDKTVGRSQAETILGTREVRVIAHQKVLVTLDHAETVDGVVELVGKGDRQLTIHGERDTVVGKKGDEKVAHDVHDVTGAKTDTIEGTLKARAKSVGIGQPNGAEEAPDSSLTSGPGEDGPELVAESELGYRLTADKEVRIISNEAGVELLAREGLTSTVSVPMIEMGKPVSGGLTVWHDKRVEIHTENDVFLSQPGEVRLRAVDQEDALVVVGSSGVTISGRTGVVDANKEIRDVSGVQNHGGG